MTTDDPAAALSPAQQALIARRLARRATPAPAATIPPRPPDAPPPLSFAQERLFFLAALAPDSPFYTIGAAVDLAGPLRAPALASALRALILRHEALRSAFALRDGRPALAIAPACPLPLTILDLAALPPPTQATLASALADAEAARPFPLATPPLFRCTLIRRSPADHTLLLRFHHLIADGWSLGIVVRDLAALYLAATTHLPPALPPLPLQPADVAFFQRQHPDRLASDLAFWHASLAHATPVLALPTDFPRPPVLSFRGARAARRLPPALVAALRAHSQRASLTPFMPLLAALAVLLARTADQYDLILGTPSATRPQRALADLVGLFITTLPLRLDLTANPTVTALLQQVRQVCLDAYDHPHAPLDQLLAPLQPQRDLSRAPLVQVLVTFLNTPLRPPQLPDLTLRWRPLDAPTARFDLTLEIAEQDDTLLLVFEYATDLFAEATITRLLAQLERLLAAMLAAPECRIAQLPLLEAAERAALLRAQPPRAPDAGADTLAALFAAQVARTPDAVALVQSHSAPAPRVATQLSYAALAAHAAQLAQHLRAQGVGPEVRVAVCLPRCPALLIALLGVVLAGGAYVPLDPHDPAARQALVLADAEVTLLLTTAALRPAPTATWTPAAPAPARDDLLLLVRPGAARRAPAAPAATPDNLAYVIYTSGSSGPPKGVLGLHRATVNRLRWLWAAVPFGPDEVSAHKTALSFVDAVAELFGPLLAGVRQALIGAAELQDLGQLEATLAAERVTRLVLVPSLLRLLLAGTGTLGARLPALRVVVSSGEALGWALAQQALGQLAGRQVLNLYGSSEVAADVTAQVVDAAALAGGVVPIGRPIANTQVYVLDRGMELVPVGVAGELYVGGAGLARGYLNRPDLTAERFVPNPYARVLGNRGWGLGDGDDSPNPQHPTPNTRLYRTGDRGRWRADGVLEYLGRVDAQVQLHGVRIEPGEVEAALRGHAGVRAAAVVVREERLVAYVVPTADDHPAPNAQRPALTSQDPAANDPGAAEAAAVDSAADSTPPTRIGAAASLSTRTSELIAYVRERLPAVMIPAAVVWLAALPLTSSGKIDRRALPAPDWASAAGRRAFVPPRTPIEIALAEIWARALGIEQVGADDNFFTLGGDSLLSILVVSRARQAGIEISAQHIAQHPTLAELAAAAAQASATTQEEDDPLGEVPLTTDQSWFLRQALREQHRWNIAAFLEVRVPLNPVLLRRAVAALYDYHDALRARFVARRGGWHQLIDGPNGQAPFSVIDLSGLDSQDQDAAIVAVTDRIQGEVDIARGPLFQVALLTLGPRRSSRLFIVGHHLVIDFASMAILSDDLQTIYQKLSRGEPPSLPRKTTSFKRWARRLHDYVRSLEQTDELDYWLSRPWDAVSHLPVDFPEALSRNSERSQQVLSTALSTDETDDLMRSIAALPDIQVPDVLLTALVRAITRRSGGRWAEVVMVESGRSVIPNALGIDLSHSVGWFAMSGLLILQRPEAEDFPDALRAIKQQLQQIPNRGYGYCLLRNLSQRADIREQLAPLRKEEVSLNYQGRMEPPTARSLPIVPAAEPIGPTRCLDNLHFTLLDCISFIASGRLVLNWTYGEHVFRRSTIEQLAAGALEEIRAFARAGALSAAPQRTSGDAGS